MALYQRVMFVRNYPVLYNESAVYGVLVVEKKE